MLHTSYELFRGRPNDDPIWIGSSELLDQGIEELESVAGNEPGEYFVYNGSTKLVVATLWKMTAGPTRIFHFWT